MNTVPLVDGCLQLIPMMLLLSPYSYSRRRQGYVDHTKKGIIKVQLDFVLKLKSRAMSVVFCNNYLPR